MTGLTGGFPEAAAEGRALDDPAEVDVTVLVAMVVVGWLATVVTAVPVDPV